MVEAYLGYLEEARDDIQAALAADLKLQKLAIHEFDEISFEVGTLGPAKFGVAGNGDYLGTLCLSARKPDITFQYGDFRLQSQGKMSKALNYVSQIAIDLVDVVRAVIPTLTLLKLVIDNRGLESICKLHVFYTENGLAAYQKMSPEDSKFGEVVWDLIFPLL